MNTLRTGCVLGVLLFLAGWGSQGAQAQGLDIAFEHFTAADGLSHSTVFAGLQDRHGFLWFGTLDGLNRCDGYGCTVFAHDPRDTTSLSNSWVWALHEDHDGVLWVGTWGGGLNRFDRATETFTRYQHDPADPHSLSGNVVKSIVQDRQGALWIGTNEGGLNRLDPQKGRFKRYEYDPADPHSLRSNNIHTVLEDREGILWIGTQGGGLSRFDRQRETFTHYKRTRGTPDDPRGMRHENVNALHEDRAGRLWIGTGNGGLHRRDRQKEIFERFIPEALGEAVVRVIYEDRRGRLWIGTYANGLFCIDDAGRVTHYLHEIDNPHSLSDNSITTLFEDHTGLLWIGTRGGVDRLNVQQPPLRISSVRRDNPTASAMTT